MRGNSLLLSAALLAAPAALPAQATAPATASTSAAAAAEPSTTEQGEASVSASTAQLTSATSADVTTGKTVLDADGGVVGKVEKVDANGAVIATGKVRVQIPISSFAKNDRGLVISATKSELEAAAAASSPS